MLEITIMTLWISSVLGVWRYAGDILHPFFWTNVMFTLYAFSHTYLYFENLSGANFLQLAGLDELSGNSLLFSSIACLFGKLAVEAIGPWSRAKSVYPLTEPKLKPIPLRLARVTSVSLFAIGFAYWIYVMAIVGGGSFNVFGNMGVWEYVIADAGLSILPYHLVFAASHLWFLSYILASRAKIPLVGFVFYPFAFLVSLTTGRLSASILLLAIPFIAVYFIRAGRAPLAKLRNFLLVGFAFMILMYFYRSYTSYLYIGRPEDFLYSDLHLFELALAHIVGRGNLPDPQQLILIQHAIGSGKLAFQYGATYFDWAYNLFGLGPTRSVGYLIHGIYFPEKSGGPTPGMIGEAIVNFGPLFMIPLAAFGYLAVKLFLVARRSGSYILRFVYCIFLLNFWALFIKVDSSLITGFLWSCAPIVILWSGLRFVRGPIS